MRRSGPIVMDEVIYYAKKVALAGEITEVWTQGGQLFANFIVSGTQDDLLRTLSGKAQRAVSLHLCDADCGQVRTGELLVHSKTFMAADLQRAPWMTNLRAVVEDAAEIDELAS